MSFTFPNPNPGANPDPDPNRRQYLVAEFPVHVLDLGVGLLQLALEGLDLGLHTRHLLLRFIELLRELRQPAM